MNNYKRQLLKCFNTRKCFTFDHPTCDKSVLRRIEDVRDDELTPSFITKSKEFCDYVFHNAPVKNIGGIHPINGKRLGVITKKYTENISSQNFTCIENVMMNLSETENKAAVQEATKYYEEKMKERINFPTKSMEAFMAVSRECENEAIQIFMDKSFKDVGQQFQLELVETVKQIKNQFLKKNNTASHTLCDEKIAALSRDFDKNLADGLYAVPGGYQKFQERIEEIKEKYNKIPNKGVQSEEVLNKYLDSKKETGATILQSDKALSKKEKEMEDERAKAQEKERERKIQEEKEAKETQRLEDEKRTAEEHGAQMLEKMKEENKILQEELKRFERQGNDELVETMKTRIARGTEERENMDKPAWYKSVWRRLVEFINQNYYVAI